MKKARHFSEWRAFCLWRGFNRCPREVAPDNLVTNLTKTPVNGYTFNQMSTPEINIVLERQLLLQLGDRLKRLRKAQGIGTVEMAARVGITRITRR